MALYIISDTKELLSGSVGYIRFQSSLRVEKEYIRYWNMYGEEFIRQEAVDTYLKANGIKYLGNYCMSFHNSEVTRFITYLHYPLQLACIALYDTDRTIVVEEPFLLDPKWLASVLRKRDLYLLRQSWSGYYKLGSDLADIYKEGIPIYFEGHCSDEFADEVDFYSCIDELIERDERFSRELDAEVFDESRIYIPGTQMLLPEYLEWKGQNKEYFSRYLEKHPDWRRIRIIENAKNDFTVGFRRHPIHWLFCIDGKWKYCTASSVKYPDFQELLLEAVLAPDPFYDKNAPAYTQIAKASRIFTLILNCNEVCDARRYWESVLFLIKYDRQKQELELCSHDTGLLEFHRLFQESEDLNEMEGE